MQKQRNQLPKGRHGNLKLVLTEDVQFLGKQGDVVEVRPGYARNYLIPRGLGTVPTEHNLRLLERYKIRVRQAREARVADLQALAQQLQKLEGVTIQAAATAEGHLYGSVGPVEISKSLRSRGMPIDAEMVRTEPLKESGIYTVPLNLGFEIAAEVKVFIIPVQEKK